MPEPGAPQDEGLQVDTAPPQDPPKEGGEEEVVDPGQVEGMGGQDLAARKKAHEAADNIDKDHPRFKKVYGEAKDAKRENEALKKELADKETAAEELRQHNARLGAAIEKIQPEAEKPGEKPDDFDAKLKDLRAKRVAAREDGNYALVDDINDEMLDIRDQKRESREQAKEAKRTTEREKETFESGVSKAVDKFTSGTPWFDRDSEDFDPAMEGAAMSYDDRLRSDPAWKSKPVGQRLAEVKRLTEERFGYKKEEKPDEEKPDPTGPGTKPPAVGGVEVGGGQPKDKGKITLTREQAETARKMFPGDPNALKNYAKQLVIIQRGG